MGIMELIEKMKAGQDVSAVSGIHEYVFSAGEHDPVWPEGFCRIRVSRRPECPGHNPGSDKGPFLFLDIRANRLLDLTGGLLESIFSLSGEHTYDVKSLEHEVNLRVNRYIAHNMIHEIREGAKCYGRDEFRDGEIREQACVCYITGASARLHLPSLVFDIEQFFGIDPKQIRSSGGAYPVSYARLLMLHLSEQFPSGEIARRYLEDVSCRSSRGRRNFDMICRRYALDSYVEEELKHLREEATDSMKKARTICHVLGSRGAVKPRVELDHEALTVSLAADCAGPVIGKKRELYYS